MRLEHLEALLRGKQLYLPRVDQFGEAWEGSFSDSPDFDSDPLYETATAEEREAFRKSYQKLRQETMQRLFYVGCWNINDAESELLWKRYMGDYPEAVAITTTIASLCALRPTPIDTKAGEFIPRYCVGEIQYIDHSIAGSVPGNDLSLFYKGRQYQDDNEFRIIVELWNMGWSQHGNPDLPIGISIPIAPAVFIKNLTVKPKSVGLKDKVNRILDEVGYDIPVCDSMLDRPAIW